MSDYDTTINEFGSMMDTSTAPSHACHSCHVELPRHALYREEGNVFKRHDVVMCLDCIKQHWKSFKKAIPAPQTPLSEAKFASHLMQDDTAESSRHNSMEHIESVNKTPSPHEATSQSTAATGSFPTDPTVCYSEARKLKRDADRLLAEHKYLPGVHTYIASLIRFLYVAHDKSRTDRPNAIDMMQSSSLLCNAVLSHTQRRNLEREGDLVLLLKAFAYYSLFHMQSGSVDPKRALESKELDHQTKKFIETSFYLTRALIYLKQVERRYGASPLHKHFYNMKAMDLLTYVEDRLGELSDDGTMRL